MKKAIHRYLEEGERAGARYSLLVPHDIHAGRYGHYLGSAVGSSLDFRDFRDYQPGDDLRHIDWGAYGRSDRLTVKLFREEVDPHVDMVLDCSRSMALEGTAKARAALGLTALLAVAASNGKCSSMVWGAADGCRDVENGGQRPSVWRGLRFNARRSLHESFNILPPRWRRRGIRILLSDLLFPGDPLVLLTRFAQEAAAVVVIQILAEADRRSFRQGNLRVVDSETGETLQLLLDETTRARYDAAVRAHQQNWYSACRKTGARMITFTAETVVAGWAVEPLEAAGVLGAL